MIINTHQKFYLLLFQTNNLDNNVSPHAFTMMKTVNTEFSSVKVWFIDQSSKALEIEDNVI